MKTLERRVTKGQFYKLARTIGMQRAMLRIAKIHSKLERKYEVLAEALF